MNNYSLDKQNNEPEMSTRLIKAAKIFGGFVAGAAVSYGMTKGFEQIIDINDEGHSQLYELFVAFTVGSGSAFITSEIIE